MLNNKKENYKHKFAILMPLHNSEKTIERSLVSILEQETEYKFSIFCVLNNCTDRTEEIIDRLSDQFEFYISKTHCLEPGIVPALNTGIFKILADPRECEFIARQDGDDFWYPNKLQEQGNFLNRNPDIDVLGTQIKIVKPESFETLGVSNYPLTHEECKKWILNAQNPIAHPSVVFKTKITKKCGIYEDIFPVAEDFFFWSKVAKYYKFANIQDILVDYTSTSNSNYSPRTPQLISNIARLIYTQ